MIANLAVPMRVLLPASIVSAVVTLALHSDKRSKPFYATALGLALMVVALIMTLSVNVPIDRQIQSWTVDSMPSDWTHVRDRWQTFHTLRTFDSLAALRRSEDALRLSRGKSAAGERRASAMRRSSGGGSMSRWIRIVPDFPSRIHVAARWRAALAAALLCGASAPVLAQDDAAVRKELEAQYQKLIAAHDREDLAAILALKTPDFHAIFPDGRVGDLKVMEQYSRQFLESNEPPYDIRMTIQRLSVSENALIAVAEVLQEVTRYKDLEGQRRKVETSVVQRETWAKTDDGWKLKCVDDVHDQKRFVDGKRVDPSKPYDPNAPPYSPEDHAAEK